MCGGHASGTETGLNKWTSGPRRPREVRRVLSHLENSVSPLTYARMDDSPSTKVSLPFPGKLLPLEIKLCRKKGCTSSPTIKEGKGRLSIQ